MAERTRPIRVEFCVTGQERQRIQRKMVRLGARNMGAYLRKMAIGGCMIKADDTQQKKQAAVSQVSSNISQIGRRIDSTGHLSSGARDLTLHLKNLRRSLEERRTMRYII